MKSVRPSESLSSFFTYLILISLKHVTGSEFDTGLDTCRRNLTSSLGTIGTYELKYTTCFEGTIPYKWSSSELIDPKKNQHQLQDNLSEWVVFKRSPKCWTVLQPLLCATFMPKVNESLGLIELPSQELCKVARSHCRLIVEQVMNGWPEFLKCENIINYRPGCKNSEIRGMNFSRGECMDPMIPVNDTSSYYEGFEGCGLKCQDPMFSNEDHAVITKSIFCCALFLGLGSAIILCTYCLDWKSSRGLPSEIIFYVILCFFVADLGWIVGGILQLWPNPKDNIVCRRDGTIQRNESDQNLFCLAQFSLVYFGSMTAIGWLAVFAYVCNLTCNAVGIIRARVENQAAYFHCLIWILSAFLTILSISLGNVDGSSLSGVCFISYKHPIARIGLVVVPISVTCLVSFFYFIKGLYRLHVIQKSPDFIPASGRQHLRQFFRRTIFFLGGCIFIMLSFVATEIYQMLRWPYWNQSLREFLICKMKLRTDLDLHECHMNTRPLTWLTGLNIFLFFAGGSLVCTWACTRDAIDTWKRKFPRCTCFGGVESHTKTTTGHRLKRHRLMAQAYEKKKRLDIPPGGSISLTLRSEHADPIGLNRLLDPVQLYQESNSRNHDNEEGEEVSSDFIKALPRMLERRNGITLEHSSNSEDRPVSADLTRQVSLGSRLDLDRNTKSKLRKLKEKLGSRKGRRGSITSFESSDLGSKHYQSSNSELDKPIGKGKTGLAALKDKLGRRNGIGWRGRFSSVSSLESQSNGNSIKLPRIRGTTNTVKRTVMVKESGIQTSLESFPFRRHQRLDKGVQTSLQSLLKEFGTQTKKSATKKQKKPNQNPMNDQNTNGNETENLTKKAPRSHGHGGGYDPVMELLKPI